MDQLHGDRGKGGGGGMEGGFRAYLVGNMVS